MNQNRALAVIPPEPDVESAPPHTVSCPMCHTVHRSLSAAAVATGEDWRCSRCGQHWDTDRLATVAAYAAWARERVGSATHLRIVPGGKGLRPDGP